MSTKILRELNEKGLSLISSEGLRKYMIGFCEHYDDLFGEYVHEGEQEHIDENS